jgi:nicotinate-nucleotide adenylyltransferase
MRIGIFGGTFDPPHIGHLILASQAAAQLHLDRLLWVLTPDPPHKNRQSISPAEIRLKMVRAAIDDDPSFELSRIDLDRPAPQYAADTIHLLREQNPGAALVYLVGGDSLRDMPRWYEPQRLVDDCEEIGVMLRPGAVIQYDLIDVRLPALRSKLREIHSPQIDIASSDIRARIASGQPYRYFLPERVYHIIERYGLYRTADPEKTTEVPCKINS